MLAWYTELLERWLLAINQCFDAQTYIAAIKYTGLLVASTLGLLALLAVIITTPVLIYKSILGAMYEMKRQASELRCSLGMGYEERGVTFDLFDKNTWPTEYEIADAGYRRAKRRVCYAKVTYWTVLLLIVIAAPLLKMM